MIFIIKWLIEIVFIKLFIIVVILFWCYVLSLHWYLWNFKEIVQIGVGNVNKFWKKIRLRLFSKKKFFRKNFIWVTKNWNALNEFYYFNSIIRPCHSKCQNFLVRIKKLAHFSLIILFSCLYHGRSCTEQKKNVQISISWMKAFRLSLLYDGRKYQKIAHKKGTKKKS